MKKGRNEIRWLHISDLHIGSPDSPWTDNAMRVKLCTFIKEHIGSIDFILVCGDLIHQGQYDNVTFCQEAQSFFQDLQNIQKHIIICFGNHDYKRDRARYSLLKDWELLSQNEKKKQQQDFSQKLKGDFNNFKVYIENNFDSSCICSTDHFVDQGIDGVNIIVLNTSIFAGQPKLDDSGNFVKDEATGLIKVSDVGQLWINDLELPSVKNINPSYPTIVLGHHPIQMFHSCAAKRLEDFIKGLPSNYYFCGHIHKNSEEVLQSGIKQMAGSGVFQDNYNVPMFVIHTLNKGANEHIHSEHYRYLDSAWIRCDYDKSLAKLPCAVNKKIENPNNKLDSHCYQLKTAKESNGAYYFDYNGGKFSLYLSKSKASDILSAHMHEKMDEVAFITSGSVYIYIENEIKKLKKDESILLPSGKLHEFIPAEYPCEYVTMGVEGMDSHVYAINWDEKVSELAELESHLQVSDDEESLDVYK